VSQVGFKERLRQELDSLRENWNQLPEKSKKTPLLDEYVRLAFQNADLDIFKPEDQVLFVLGLARVLHGRKGLKPPGFLNALAQDAEAAIKKFDLSGRRQACKYLAQRNEYKTKYGNYRPNTLLKLLEKATDRHENPDYEELTKGRPPRKKHDRHVLYKKKAGHRKKPRRGK
jgi:DNA repair exonuclease SbcCD ATPase subunit